MVNSKIQLCDSLEDRQQVKSKIIQIIDHM